MSAAHSFSAHRWFFGAHPRPGRRAIPKMRELMAARTALAQQRDAAQDAADAAAVERAVADVAASPAPAAAEVAAAIAELKAALGLL